VLPTDIADAAAVERLGRQVGTGLGVLTCGCRLPPRASPARSVQSRPAEIRRLVDTNVGAVLSARLALAWKPPSAMRFAVRPTSGREDSSCCQRNSWRSTILSHEAAETHAKKQSGTQHRTNG
jgi:hypothetical protein